MNKQAREEMKEYVIKCVSELYNYNFYEAKEIVESSSFISILNNNPNYVMHYDDEYWANMIMEEYKQIKGYKKELVLQ